MCEHNVLEDGHDAGLCAKCKLELVSLAGVCIHGVSKMRYCYQCELANLRAENEQLKQQYNEAFVDAEKYDSQTAEIEQLKHEVQLAELRGMDEAVRLLMVMSCSCSHRIHKEIERRRKELEK